MWSVCKFGCLAETLALRLDAGSFLFHARTTTMILLIHSHSILSHGGFRCSQPMRPTSCSSGVVCDADTLDLHFLNGVHVACLLKNTPPNIWGEMSNKYGAFQLVAASKGATEATLEKLYFADIPARWSDPSDTLASGHHCWVSSFLKFLI